MSLPSEITIGFSTTNKWISRSIRFITRSKFSHAWIAFYDPSLNLRLVLQAEAWGVELRPWERWRRENVAKAEFALDSPDSAPLILRNMISKSLGAKYDWWSAALVGLKAWIKRWFKSGLELRPNRSPRRLMCAELVTDYLLRLNSFLRVNPDQETTSPLELYEMMRAGQTRGTHLIWLDEDLAR